MAGGTWDKLEQVFEDRVARALSKLGVYTQNDVEKLAERVDALSEAVNELIKSGGRAAPAARASKSATSRKRSAKTAKASSTQGESTQAAPADVGIPRKSSKRRAAKKT
jgi:hypothetical protein